MTHLATAWITPADALSRTSFRDAVERTVDVAVDTDVMAVLVGMYKGGYLICAPACRECSDESGTVTVVSDILEAEMAANGLDLPPGWRIVRPDGRSCTIWRSRR